MTNQTYGEQIIAFEYSVRGLVGNKQFDSLPKESMGQILLTIEEELNASIEEELNASIEEECIKIDEEYGTIGGGN